MMRPVLTLEDIRSRLEEYLRANAASDDLELTPATPLLDVWFTDSIQILEMVVFLEETFAIEVARADINAENFQTLETLLRFVARRVSG
jgi:acyl carrier protein